MAALQQERMNLGLVAVGYGVLRGGIEQPRSGGALVTLVLLPSQGGPAHANMVGKATMSSKKTFILSALLVVMVVAVISYRYFQNEGDASTPPTPSASSEGPVYPDHPELWPERVMESYPYYPDSYPAWAEAYPDAPCATWVNGGLGWVFVEDATDVQGDWGVMVWQPVWRFCGFPRPYPEKPEKPGDSMPPEWAEWDDNRLATTPNRTGAWEQTPAPEPTSSP